MRIWAGNAGFSRGRLSLQTPKSAIAGRQLAKVSGHTREYSRFAETVGGDRVRSRLPPGGRSPSWDVLGPQPVKIGNSVHGLRPARLSQNRCRLLTGKRCIRRYQCFATARGKADCDLEAAAGAID